MSKGGGQPAATTQTTTSEFPTELRPYVTDILERAKGQMERKEEEGFQAYTGPRIAEFEPEQLVSQQAIREFAGRGVAASPALSSAQTYYTPALGLTLGQAERFGAPQATQYMSPYQQAVIDVEKREAMRSFAPQMQQIGAQAVGAGGFGGSRQAILEAEAGRNLQQQLGDIQTRGLQSAYDRAQAAFEAQKARERGAAGALSQMGAALPAQALKEIGALQALGSERQQMAQRALDLGYSQFQEEKMYPTQTLQEYQSVIRGFPFTPSTYSTSSYIAPPASLAQNVLGIGTGIAGLAGAFGGFKEGGVVQLQEAGKVLKRPEPSALAGSNQAYLERIKKEQADWDAKYGTTHNPDGTPKTVEVEQEEKTTVTTEKPITSQESADTYSGGNVEGGEFDTSTEDSTTDDKKYTLADLSRTLYNDKLTNLEKLLEEESLKIKGREVLTPELKALQAEYTSMLSELPEKEKERKEELKKQKYLQLAEFGRGLLGADTTKGLLAQVAQAGEKPLARVGELVSEEGELSDKQRAERLGLMGKQVELSQAEQTAERQTADLASVSKQLIDIQTARNEAAGIDSSIGVNLINDVILKSGLDPYTDVIDIANQIGQAQDRALEIFYDGIRAGTISDQQGPADAAFRKIFGAELKKINVAPGGNGGDSSASAGSNMGSLSGVRVQ